MNNKQRKSLYESILKDVAKIVKKRIDEAEEKEALESVNQKAQEPTTTAMEAAFAAAKKQ